MNISLISSLLIVCNPLLFRPVTEISIHEAIEKNLIEVEVESTGQYTGESVLMNIKPLSNGNYKIMIPAGTHFISDDSEDQNMLVVQNQILAVQGNETKSFKIDGYCSQQSNRAPKESSGFTISKVQNDTLAKLCQYMADKSFSPDVKSAAVWAVSDKATVSHIYGTKEEESAAKELRKYICDLTGRKDVWYNTLNNISITEDRRIEIQPVKISGDIEYQVKKAGTVKYVLMRDGNDLFNMGESEIEHTGAYSFHFDLSVKTFREGNYQFKVFLDEELIHERSFEV